MTPTWLQTRAGGERTEDFLAAAEALIRAKRSRHTQDAYRRDFEKWLLFCNQVGADPRTADLIVATRFRERLAGELSQASVHRILSSLSAVYGKLLLARRASANPFHAAFLARPPAPEVGKTEAISAADAETVIDGAEDDRGSNGRRDAALLRLLHETGARRETIATLARDAIIRRDRRLFARVIVKGQREVEIALGEGAQRAVERWLKEAPPSPYVFPGDDGGSITPNAVYHIVRMRAAAVGLEHVHPHRFRAAFITDAYQAEVPEADIRDTVHHKSVDMTRRYNRGTSAQKVVDAVSEYRKKKGR